MSEHVLIPSIEKRLQGLIEVNRRNRRNHGIDRTERLNPTVTLGREFGCEGYPVAEKLQVLLEKATGVPWVIMDRALLDAVAKDHDLNRKVLENIGVRNRFLDEMLSTFTPRWKSDKDYYRLLSHQIVALAQEGHVIFVGRGAALLTQQMDNCFHFRIVAPMSFKVKSMVARTGLSRDEAQDLIRDRQRQRDVFLKDFLGRDVADPTLYHLLFNNARCSADQIAELVAEIIYPGRPS